MPIDVIDLFAGPGGLGEGFASLNGGRDFRIVVSAEMESSAHKTLTLRSFFRHALRNGDKRALDAYYAYCHRDDAPHPSLACPLLWNEAEDESQQMTLGEDQSNSRLDTILKEHRLDSDNTVLIGGPPCQAYSIVGRSRNRGKKDYVAEDDHRHFLYKEYLRILAKVRPAAFVMENVKGILSSKVGGRQVFQDILADLSDPTKASGLHGGERYIIYSLSSEVRYESGMETGDIDPSSFIVRAEEHGIPQARHRVILLGVRERFAPSIHPLLTRQPQRNVGFALRDLPKLRSRLSTADSDGHWFRTVRNQGELLARDAARKRDAIAAELDENVKRVSAKLPTGAPRMLRKTLESSDDSYLRWVRDERLEVWLHHHARSHMASDLGRYFYAATFAKHWGRTPKGHLDFSLTGLAPDHANWESGKFVDRFRVQQRRFPSTTITSHIAKDGHYFIHHDPAQCRSLTVREAARLQTFPDNYFFQGNRTQQYHQVGNAVPPLLASGIADLLHQTLRRVCKENQ